MRKRILYIIFVIVFIVISFLIYYVVTNSKYNDQLDIKKSDQVKLYQFKEGTGFIERKATYFEKNSIWELIESLVPTEKLEEEDIKNVGGYAAFYFNNGQIRTNFTLIQLQNNTFYVNVVKMNIEGEILNQYYFISSIDLTVKIEEAIINR